MSSVITLRDGKVIGDSRPIPRDATAPIKMPSGTPYKCGILPEEIREIRGIYLHKRAVVCIRNGEHPFTVEISCGPNSSNSVGIGAQFESGDIFTMVVMCTTDAN
jgi:hypothetical protein